MRWREWRRWAGLGRCSAKLPELAEQRISKAAVPAEYDAAALKVRDLRQLPYGRKRTNRLSINLDHENDYHFHSFLCPVYGRYSQRWEPFHQRAHDEKRHLRSA